MCNLQEQFQTMAGRHKSQPARVQQAELLPTATCTWGAHLRVRTYADLS